MEKILKTTAAICAGVLIMLFLEGMLTFGAAFCFEKYNVFGWIIQGVILLRCYFITCNQFLCLVVY